MEDSRPCLGRAWVKCSKTGSQHYCSSHVTALPGTLSGSPFKAPPVTSTKRSSRTVSLAAPFSARKTLPTFYSEFVPGWAMPGDEVCTLPTS